MLRYHFLLLAVVVGSIKQIECSKIQDLLPGYYDSDTVKRFQDEWKKYQRAFENAIETGLQQEFGRSSVNVFEENRPESRVLSKGFTLSDGVVNVFFFDMVLRELPLLVRPKLTLVPPTNYQAISSMVDRMFIDANYYVARNKSSEVYAHPRDQKNMSPFSLQQVESYGNVAIIAEGCMLSALSVVTLNADSISLGHTAGSCNIDRITRGICGCKFSVEISTPSWGVPPVIAPYFHTGPKEQLEQLLSVPIIDELQGKLQAALYSYVNTSVLFGPDAHEYSKNQHQLFKSYAEFIRTYVFKVNMDTLSLNKGVVDLPNYDISVDSLPWVKNANYSCDVGLKNMKLYGLETAYVGMKGGPYHNPQFVNELDRAADAIIFSSLQIRGQVNHVDGKGAQVFDFTAEITDVTVNIQIRIKKDSTEISDMQMKGWSSMAFGIIPWKTPYYERISYQSLVHAYILNELPTRVVKHLTSILGKIANQPDSGSGGNGGSGSDGGSGGGGGSGGDGGNGGGGGSGSEGGSGNSDADKKLVANLSDGNDGKKEFFTDDNIDKDFFTDDNIKSDFFTDDNIDKNFFTDGDSGNGNNGKSSGENANGNNGESSGNNVNNNNGQSSGENANENNGQSSGENANENNGESSGDNVNNNNGQSSGDNANENNRESSGDNVNDNNGQSSVENDNNGESSTDNVNDNNDNNGESNTDNVNDNNGESNGDNANDNNGDLNTDNANDNNGGSSSDHANDNNGGSSGDVEKGDDGGLSDDVKNGNNAVKKLSHDVVGAGDDEHALGNDNAEGVGNDRGTDGGTDGGDDGAEGVDDDVVPDDEVEAVDDDGLEGAGNDKGSISLSSHEGFDIDQSFLDENFFSDFDSRKHVAKNNNGTTHIGASKKREHDRKKVRSDGKTKGEENINKDGKDNPRRVKKPVLPPNVHNMRRLNNPHMSENEIR